MRRIVGFVALAVGAILLFMAPLARFYVTPRIKKIPTDFFFREVSVGTGTYLDSSTFQVVGPVPVRNVTVQRGDPAGSTPEVAAWDQFTGLQDTQNHHQITVDVERLTLERTTAASVACCGESQRRGNGLTALFPIGTQQRTYPFWDFNAKANYPAAYQGTETVDGLTTYRFHQHIAPVRIKQMKLAGRQVGLPDQPVVDLSWMYSADTDIWVEPVTGGIVKASQTAQQWFADPSGTKRLTVADIDAGWDDATVRDAVDKASSQKGQLRLVEFRLPVFGALAGVVLVAVGLALLARSPAREERRLDAPARAPDPASTG